MQFQRFFSVDSPKAVKAQKYGLLNAINYMAPHRLAGVGDLCPHASKGCVALCLGEHSGAAALYPAVLKSRIAKAQLLMRDRPQFLKEMTAGIRRARATAKRQKLKLCVRLNGATDIAWERLAPVIFADNADLQFVDYTKIGQTRARACSRPAASKLSPDVLTQRNQRGAMPRGFGRGRECCGRVRWSVSCGILRLSGHQWRRARLAPSRWARSRRGAIAQRNARQARR
jgi:hypothetical protein